MAGGVFKSSKDKIVESIPARDKLAQNWGKAQAGAGVLVTNAFKDFPNPNEGDPTVKSNSNAYYKWNGTVFIKISEGEGLDFDPVPVYTGASPTTVDFGDLLAGSSIQGMTLAEIFEKGLVKYLLPSFTSFQIQGQATTIEVGQSIGAGIKNFTWATGNSINVKAGSIIIRDETGSTDLTFGLNNDGNENYNLVNPINLLAPGNRTFRIRALNTKEQSFQRDFTVSAVYKLFYDAVAQAPADSVQVRAAANNRFLNGGNTFTLNTGAIHTTFFLWIPSSSGIVSVVDLDALNLNITSQYILTSNFQVNDSIGTPVNGKLYVMTQTVPYSSSHRHQITIS